MILDGIDRSLGQTPIEELLSLPLDELDGFQPKSLLGVESFAAAERHRILPLLRAEWLVPDLRPQLRDQTRQMAFMHLELEAALRAVVEVLASSGIECRVLKGLATGPLDYPSVGLRQTGDVDLLVRPAELDAAVDALTYRGYRPDEHVSTVDEGLLKGATLVSERGVEIDLHSRLTRFMPASTDVLFSSPEPIGNGMLAMSREMRLVHAAGHLLWSKPSARRLSSLVDVSVILDRGVDLDAVLRTAEAAGAVGFVGEALRIEHRLRGRNTTQLDKWRSPSMLERKRILGEPALVAKHALTMQHLDGWGDRGSYVAQFVYPGRTYLAARGGLGAYYGQMLPGFLRRGVRAR